MQVPADHQQGQAINIAHGLSAEIISQGMIGVFMWEYSSSPEPVWMDKVVRVTHTSLICGADAGQQLVWAVLYLG
jgi:hypothetical protein